MESISGALASFGTWLAAQFLSLLESLYNILIDIIQGVINVLPTFVNSALALLTYACPAPSLSSEQAAAVASGGSVMSSMLTIALKTFAWLFPVSFMIYFFQMIVCAMTVYVTWMIVMRWLKIST